jgi:DNA-binding response OmpR family regulator
MGSVTTILVVDDDAGTRFLVPNALLDAMEGVAVVTAGNGREALDVLAHRTIDVLVTDLGMPVLDGFSLIASLYNARSTMPIVVLTGLTAPTLERRLAGFAGLQVLRKPFEPSELVARVRAAIGHAELGQVEGIPLPAVLQLVEAERRSCALVATSRFGRARLHFASGALVAARCDDGRRGDAAVRALLTWPDPVDIAFEHLAEDVRAATPLNVQRILLDLALEQDASLAPRGSSEAPAADPATSPKRTPPRPPAGVFTTSRTVLIVDDDPAMLRLLEQGLPRHLAGYAVATATDGRAAVEYVRGHPVDVLVTDLRMPGMDGFELLAYVRNNHPNLPVVVLSVMTSGPADLRSRGAMRVMSKPTSPAAVAAEILAVVGETARGRLASVPLAALLHLMRVERKTCSLLVRSSERKGRLHFLSGDLVNAYAFELGVEGEEAARHILAWDMVTIDFERSLHNHERRIVTPLEQLLLEVAASRDERAVGLGDRSGAAERSASRERSGPGSWSVAGSLENTPEPQPAADREAARAREVRMVELRRRAATLREELEAIERELGRLAADPAPPRSATQPRVATNTATP